MTISDRRRIEVYVRPDDTPLQLAFDLAHEIGHAFDLERNNQERRNRWRALRGIDPSVPWFGCNRCPDYETPAGDFAETFAYMLLGPGSYHSRMAPQPSGNVFTEAASFCGIEPVKGTFLEAMKRRAPALERREPAIDVKSRRDPANELKTLSEPALDVKARPETVVDALRPTP
jgi:hypothetical protein